MSDKPMMRRVRETQYGKSITLSPAFFGDPGLWFRTDFDPATEAGGKLFLANTAMMLVKNGDYEGARDFAIRLAAALSPPTQPVERERCEGCGCLGVVQLGWHKDTGLDEGRLRCRLPRNHPGPCQPERRSGERRIGERRSPDAGPMMRGRRKVPQPNYDCHDRRSSEGRRQAPSYSDRRSGKDRRQG